MKKFASKFHSAATACILLSLTLLLIVGTFVSGRVFMSVVTYNNDEMVSPQYDRELRRTRNIDEHDDDDSSETGDDRENDRDHDLKH